MSTLSVSSIFEKLAHELAKEPEVELADGSKKSFGAGTLRVKGKIFAMVTSTGHFVVKLPRNRVEILEAEGTGSKFDPGHGRLMKEWLHVTRPEIAGCRALARDALAFVSGAT